MKLNNIFLHKIALSIGQKFAMNEEKTLISAILRKYKVTAVETPETIVMTADVILKPFHGMFLRFEHRS